MRLTGIAAAFAVAATAAAAAFADGSTVNAQSSPIRHVVVIDMENHSFDNVLGFWCDDNPGRCPDGGMPAQVTLSGGAVVTPTKDPDTVPTVDHTSLVQLTAIDGGKMDGWGQISGCTAAANYGCISGYQPSQIPNLTTLAQNFAISDMTFSLAASSSWGGHLYAAVGNLDGGFEGSDPVPAAGVTPGPGWGCNSDKVTWWRPQTGPKERIPSCLPDPRLALANGGAFEPTPAPYEPTIFDRLTAAGLTWKIFGTPKPGGGGGGYAWSICPSIAECQYTSQLKKLVRQTQFETDAAAGTLPNYSVVTPGGPGPSSSCHNGQSMTACDNRIGQVVSAVENGPDWASTAIFITFDDCGCFYDQVPPPVGPDGTQEGPRLPLIIASPYVKAGYTDTTATTFAGILAYTEQNFGLAPLGVNDAQAYPFTNAFDYSQVPLKGIRTRMTKLPESALHIKLTPAEVNDPT
jgi:phospholipase C